MSTFHASWNKHDVWKWSRQIKVDIGIERVKWHLCDTQTPKGFSLNTRTSTLLFDQVLLSLFSCSLSIFYSDFLYKPLSINISIPLVFIYSCYQYTMQHIIINTWLVESPYTYQCVKVWHIRNEPICQTSSSFSIYIFWYTGTVRAYEYNSFTR